MKNMQGKFQIVHLSDLNLLIMRISTYTNSLGSMSKGFFDVLLCFSAYCCDFGYFHIYS